MKRALHRAWKRAGIVPFEMAIAVLLVVSGVTSFFGFGLPDPVADLLPGWELAVLSVVTVLAGALMQAGILCGIRRIEMPGLALLVAAVLSRFVLYGNFFGFGMAFLITGVFDGAIVMAAVGRLRALARGDSIARINGNGGGKL